MSKSVLQLFRKLHKQLASVLFIFFFFIGLTGSLLAFKSFFTKTIFENKNIRVKNSLNKFLPLDSLEKLAVAYLNEKANTNFKKSEKVEIKLSNGSIV